MSTLRRCTACSSAANSASPGLVALSLASSHSMIDTSYDAPKLSLRCRHSHGAPCVMSAHAI